MQELLEQLVDHLKALTYVQVSEAHSIRYKAAEAMRDPVIAKRINALKFNTWFLDPPAKRKKQFERERATLISIIESKIK